MSCCRGCAMGATSRRMPTSRFHRRSIGAIGQVEGEVSFDVSGQLAQGQQALATAQNVQTAVQQFGDAPSDQQAQQVWAGIVAAGNQIVPGAGTALDALWGILPKAGAGPGSCVTNPPNGPLDTSWKYYVPYSELGGSYTTPPAGTFESFVYPILVKNAELAANCYPQMAIPDGQLLAGLIAGWNATHNGPTRVIARTGLNAWGNMDPIAYTLAKALLTNTGPGFNAQVPPAASFTINGGSRKPKYVPGLLHLAPPAPVGAKPPAAKTPSAVGPILETTAIVGGVAALVWTGLRVATHRPVVPSGAGRRLRSLLHLR